MILNLNGSMDKGSGRMPAFTYTGNYTLVDDGVTEGVQNWRLKLLTSGVLTFTRPADEVDVFVVGGGGGGYLGGGGGGYTNTRTGLYPTKGLPYTVIIGAGGAPRNDGGETSAFGVSAEGGKGAFQSGGQGADGGCAGGSASYSGEAEAGAGDGRSKTDGVGQGTTTREFGESDKNLYAGGGGGGTYNGIAGAGGGGGGGAGGTHAVNGTNGKANYGGGGGGSYATPGTGGCGIVIIRNHRGVTA